MKKGYRHQLMHWIPHLMPPESDTWIGGIDTCLDLDLDSSTSHFTCIAHRIDKLKRMMESTEPRNLAHLAVTHVGRMCSWKRMFHRGELFA